MKRIVKRNLTEMAKALFKEERTIKRLDGWFLVQEINLEMSGEYESKEIEKAEILKEIAKRLPIGVSNNSVFVRTQRESFARSYALINPSFKVEEFSGYCDSTAVFEDIEPNEEFSRERIEKVRKQMEKTTYVEELSKA